MEHPRQFSDPALALPAALRQALAARGYDSAMPVQTAILDPAARGRDLVVSSPTGSGKTIAFGAALAETLLAAVATTADATATPAKAADKPRAFGQQRAAVPPRALVVVPTRELAAQVREELGWLLAETGWRLAALTGGTAISGDLRALRRGVDVAIGTPGRLCDLLRREALSLGGLEVVVLDEADEMLDLGFREDLEILLAAAPVERRTLLFSATLPPPIRALARKFQRDALAIDPRRETRPGEAPGLADNTARNRLGDAPTAGPHEDITYVAHLIAGDDRLAAVVNVLRASGDGRAIVFCTTRDSVGALHRELLARGFAATAISGERAQAERDRALDQVRQGEAQILVATNVAARGLHLPDVDLIVHADLPLNVESLTHRSGRTGRAGRKGTAVVISSLAERRKAERLLAGARVRVAWTTPPAARAIADAACTRLCDLLAGEAEVDADAPAEIEADAGAPGAIEIEAASESKSASEAPTKTASKPKSGTALMAGDRPDVDALLARLRERVPLEDIARRLLARELEHLPVGERLLPIALPGSPGAAKGASGATFGGKEPLGRHRAPGDFTRAGVLFRINIGAQDQADPRWLLPLICRRGGVTRHEVGAIRVGPSETRFEIAGDAAADFALAASQRDPRAPDVRVERVDGAGAGGGGRGAEAGDARGGGASQPAPKFQRRPPSDEGPRAESPKWKAPPASVAASPASVAASPASVAAPPAPVAASPAFVAAPPAPVTAASAPVFASPTPVAVPPTFVAASPAHVAASPQAPAVASPAPVAAPPEAAPPSDATKRPPHAAKRPIDATKRQAETAKRPFGAAKRPPVVESRVAARPTATARPFGGKPSLGAKRPLASGKPLGSKKPLGNADAPPPAAPLSGWSRLVDAAPSPGHGAFGSRPHRAGANGTQPLPRRTRPDDAHPRSAHPRHPHARPHPHPKAGKPPRR